MINSNTLQSILLRELETEEAAAFKIERVLLHFQSGSLLLLFFAWLPGLEPPMKW